jgi:transcription termination factor Rho
LVGRSRTNPRRPPVPQPDPVPEIPFVAEEVVEEPIDEAASGKSLQEAKNRWIELKRMGMKELINRGLELGLPEPRLLRKQALVFSILEKETGDEANIYAEGVLEVMDEGYGFLRSPDHSYVAGPDDVYVSATQIKRFGLITGDTISGMVRAPKENEKYFALLRIQKVNGDLLEKCRSTTSRRCTPTWRSTWSTIRARSARAS